MASAVPSAARSAAEGPLRAPRATLPQPLALRLPRERRPGGPERPAPEPAPERPPRRPVRRGRGTRPGGRGRSARAMLLLDRLLRGRMWVALLAVLLTGIVFLNVALLEINGSIARLDERSSELGRENAALRMRVARLGSSERIQRAAAARGFVPAQPGQVGYLVTRPGDASEAARALEQWPASPPAGRDASPAARAGGEPATSAGTASVTATPDAGAGQTGSTTAADGESPAPATAGGGSASPATADGGSATATPTTSSSTPESPSAGEASTASP